MKRIIRFTAIVAFVGSFVSTQAQTVHNVSVQNFFFQPADLIIEVGDVVVWTNQSGFHNVGTSAFPGNSESFGNSPGVNWEYEHTFTEAGFNQYRCDIHPMMQGTITVVVGGSNLQGTVAWIESCGARDMTVIFYETGSALSDATYNTTLNSDGTFEITDVNEGIWDIYIKVDGHLQVAFLNTDINSGENSIDVGNLIAGDVETDNGINIDDLTSLLFVFGTSTGDPNFNGLADLNCDGGANIDDLTSLLTNFGSSGATP